MCVTHERFFTKEKLLGFPQSILVVVVKWRRHASGLFPEISMKCYTKPLNLAFRRNATFGRNAIVEKQVCGEWAFFFLSLKTTILISSVRCEVMYGIENPERCETSASDSGVNGREVIQCLEV